MYQVNSYDPRTMQLESTQEIEDLDRLTAERDASQWRFEATQTSRPDRPVSHWNGRAWLPGPLPGKQPGVRRHYS